MEMPETFAVNFVLQDWQAIVNLLQEHPHRIVDGLIVEIRRQVGEAQGARARVQQMGNIGGPLRMPDAVSDADA